MNRRSVRLAKLRRTNLKSRPQESLHPENPLHVQTHVRTQGLDTLLEGEE